jgi:hypothetical protein
MKLIKLALTTLLTTSCFLSSAQATIVVNVQADLLKDQNGLAAPLGSMALLVASTSDGVFGGITPGASTAAGSLLGGGDDYVVGRIPASAWADIGAFEVAFSSSGAGALNLSSIPGWTQGDPLALIWVPALTANAATIPLGARYGLYSSATAKASDGSAAWITPPDGSLPITLTFVTTDGGIFSPGATASNAPAASRSTLTVVPEPATASLGLFGLAALCGFRRRRA